MVIIFCDNIIVINILAVSDGKGVSVLQCLVIHTIHGEIRES